MNLALRVASLMVRGAGTEVSRDLPYRDGPRHRLDVYRPNDRHPPAPVIVFFHGGHWTSGSRAEYGFAGTALATRGFVAIVPDYRLHPSVQFPAFVEDGAAVVGWARQQAAAFGGDPARLFLMGYSAGSHIVALLALDRRYLRAAGLPHSVIRGAIGLAGPYDFLPLSDRMAAVFGPPEQWPSSQPINFADGDGPPMLLLHGDADKVIDPSNATRLAGRIRQRGGRVKAVRYPRVGHARILLALLPPWHHSPPVLADVAAFIGEH